MAKFSTDEDFNTEEFLKIIIIIIIHNKSKNSVLNQGA